VLVGQEIKPVEVEEEAVSMVVMGEELIVEGPQVLVVVEEVQVNQTGHQQQLRLDIILRVLVA